jgi:hypothetical protein
LARTNFTFEKRRRELDKKAKKEARKQLKAENKARAALGIADPGEPTPADESAAPVSVPTDADPES